MSLPEAWTYQDHKIIYGVLRRFEMLRWAWAAGRFRSARARRRATIWILRGYECDICRACGRPVRLVWWCPDAELWRFVTGFEGGSGICCPACFDVLAHSKGVQLAWTARRDEDAPAGSAQVTAVYYDTRLLREVVDYFIDGRGVVLKNPEDPGGKGVRFEFR